MTELVSDEKFVWYLMRGSGVVLLALLTLSTALGVLATARVASRWWPRFATQALHRNVSLLTVVLLVVHLFTAVIHEYVDIRWTDLFVPFVGSYEPFWIGLGTLAVDAVAILVATSLVRDRLDHRSWRVLHVTSYGAWAASILHGLGLGTDATSTGWGLGVNITCVCVVGVCVFLRLGTLSAERRHESRYAA